MVPREYKNNAYAKFGGTNKEYYGIFRSGLLPEQLFRGGIYTFFRKLKCNLKLLLHCLFSSEFSFKFKSYETPCPTMEEE